MYTYDIIQLTPRVIYKYNLWNKCTNDVMIFCEWIKSMLNIDKALDKISNINKKQREIQTIIVIGTT